MERVKISARSTHFINVARSCAALYVVLHHVALGRNFPFPFSIFKHFGHQAVIAFFLMSGFVIHANERHRVLVEPARYALRRFLRIYPALLIALLVSIAINAVEWTPAEAIGNLLALQDTIDTPGTWVGPFMQNSPLWSLSYEIWFYLLYPFAMIAYVRHEQVTNIAIGMLCALSYAFYIFFPQHFLVMTAYFASWWIGAMIAEAYGRGQRNALATAIPMAGLALTCIVATLPIFGQRGHTSDYPVLQANHLWSALIFAIVIFGPVGAVLVRLCKLAPVRFSAMLASISYGLYIFHWPILRQWSLARSTPGFLAAVVVLVIAAWCFDRQLAKWLASFTRPKTRAAVSPSPAKTSGGTADAN